MESLSIFSYTFQYLDGHKWAPSFVSDKGVLWQNFGIIVYVTNQDLSYFLQAEVGRLNKKQMSDILCRAINADPRLMLHVMQPATRQPGGYHPRPEDATPDWCVCGRCREMPSQRERRCCGKARCLSQVPVSV